MEQIILFYEQYEWSVDRDAMKFWAVVDDTPIICWAEKEALLVLASSADDEDANPAAYFVEHLNSLHDMARDLIVDKKFDDSNSIVINKAVLNELM